MATLNPELVAYLLSVQISVAAYRKLSAKNKIIISGQCQAHAARIAGNYLFSSFGYFLVIYFVVVLTFILPATIQ
jgi:hypothetical protein